MKEETGEDTEEEETFEGVVAYIFHHFLTFYSQNSYFMDPNNNQQVKKP